MTLLDAEKLGKYLAQVENNTGKSAAIEFFRDTSCRLILYEENGDGKFVATWSTFERLIVYLNNIN